MLISTFGSPPGLARFVTTRHWGAARRHLDLFDEIELYEPAPVEECAERAATARQHFVDAEFNGGGATVPGTTVGDWQDAGQCRDCFKPAFGQRPRESVQYTMALSNFDEADDAFDVDEDRDGEVEYSFDRPDFDARFLNANLVIRWEFLPGSTAYLVWSQTRNHYVKDGSFDAWENMDLMFSEGSPTNVFLVKFSYRFGLR